MTTVYVLQKYGDDYHGDGTIVGVYATRELAQQAEQVELTEPPCECGFTHAYGIHQFEVEDQ